VNRTLDPNGVKGAATQLQRTVHRMRTVQLTINSAIIRESWSSWHFSTSAT
jgi:hypothetical protein